MTLVTLTYTTSQTITIPSHVKRLASIMLKGGGGGGQHGRNDPPVHGTGGTEGAITTLSDIDVTPGGQYEVVIGTKGLGGTPEPGSNPTAGGETAAFGQTALGGNPGAFGSSPTAGAGVNGGAAGTSYSTDGQDATGYGCGGGGGYGGISPLGAGGDGSNGVVIITYYEPAISFSGTPTEDTAPASVAFTASATESPTLWAWSFGDGGSSAVQNPSHTYDIPGKFTVALTVTNAYCTVTETKTEYISMYWEPSAQAFFLMADPRGV